jgi:hypothetical protein
MYFTEIMHKYLIRQQIYHLTISASQTANTYHPNTHMFMQSYEQSLK